MKTLQGCDFCWENKGKTKNYIKIYIKKCKTCNKYVCNQNPLCKMFKITCITEPDHAIRVGRIFRRYRKFGVRLIGRGILYDGNCK